MFGLGADSIGALSAGTNVFNYMQQAKNLEWQKNVQSTEWEREDNAVQRRKADLIAAGMSPILAAGQAAGSGGVVSTQAPQLPSSAQDMIALARMEQDMATTAAQEDLLIAQAQKVRTDNVNAKIDTSIKAKDLQRYGQSGINLYNSSAFGKLLSDILSAKESGYVKGAKDSVQRGYENYSGDAKKIKEAQERYEKKK